MRFCNCKNINAEEMKVDQLKSMVDDKLSEQLDNLEQYYEKATETLVKPGPASVFDQFRDRAIEIFKKQRTLAPDQTIDKLIENSLQKAVDMFDQEKIPGDNDSESGASKEQTIFQKTRQFIQMQNEEWIARIVQSTLNEAETKKNSENVQIERVKKYFQLIIMKMIDLCDKCAEVQSTVDAYNREIKKVEQSK